MKKRIIVVDGMGGGIGAQLVELIRASFDDRVEIIGLGTNSNATERMLKSGADKGASGENAIKVSAGTGSLIMGPLGIVIPNGMLGEITSAMAEAVLTASCERILIPVAQNHFILAGFDQKPLGQLLSCAMTLAKEKLGDI